MRYIFRNSIRLAGEARARCCNVVASVQAWRRRTALNCEATTSASTVSGYRHSIKSCNCSEVVFVSINIAASSYYTVALHPKKIWHSVRTVPCQQLQSFRASAPPLLTVWLQFSRQMNPADVRPCVVVCVAAQFLNSCLMLPLWLWVCEPVVETGRCMVFTIYLTLEISFYVHRVS